MLITHIWSIQSLEQLNNGTGTVTNILYKVHSSDSDSGVSCNTTDKVELIQTENIENFIEYQDLTEEIVLGWVKEKLGQNLGNHEVNNASWINSVVNPPAPRTISKPLPWTT